MIQSFLKLSGTDSPLVQQSKDHRYFTTSCKSFQAQCRTFICISVAPFSSFLLLSHLFYWLPLVGQWSHGFLFFFKTKESHQLNSQRPSLETRAHLAFKPVAFCCHLLKDQHISFINREINSFHNSCEVDNSQLRYHIGQLFWPRGFLCRHLVPFHHICHVVSLPPSCSLSSHLPRGFFAAILFPFITSATWFLCRHRVPFHHICHVVSLPPSGSLSSHLPRGFLSLNHAIKISHAPAGHD